MEKIAKETFPRSIEVTASIGADLRPIKGDATQLHQILLNLCVNARDAMPDGGRIHITAENVRLTEAEARQMLGARAADYVRLRVQDTGMGIPQEIIDRIFEPFFTTKGVGKGTGLGLSTVLSIVKNHGGLLDVSSVVGKGTTFTMLFPPTESVELTAVADQSPAAGGNGQLVLVVDDEPLIRELLASVLTGNGYRVIAAEDGARGVELFKQHAAEINIVMIDMMMPVLDGYKAIPLMHKIRPATKFIAISGLMQTADLTQTAPTAQIEVLSKPFTVQKVLETVARLQR